MGSEGWQVGKPRDLLESMDSDTRNYQNVMERFLLNLEKFGKWYSARMTNDKENLTHHERC